MNFFVVLFGLNIDGNGENAAMTLSRIWLLPEPLLR